MARAPPADDSDPDLIEFGIPVLDDHLEAAGIEFPAHRDEIEAALGDIEIPFDARGHTLQLGAALDRVDQTEFETKTDLLDTLHPVFEGYRRRASTGVLGFIRSVLPF